MLFGVGVRHLYLKKKSSGDFDAQRICPILQEHNEHIIKIINQRVKSLQFQVLYKAITKPLLAINSLFIESNCYVSIFIHLCSILDLVFSIFQYKYYYKDQLVKDSAASINCSEVIRYSYPTGENWGRLIEKCFTFQFGHYLLRGHCDFTLIENKLDML